MTLGMPSIRMLNIEKRKQKNFQEVFFLKKEFIPRVSLICNSLGAF